MFLEPASALKDTRRISNYIDFAVSLTAADDGGKTNGRARLASVRTGGREAPTDSAQQTLAGDQRAPGESSLATQAAKKALESELEWHKMRLKDPRSTVEARGKGLGQQRGQKTRSRICGCCRCTGIFEDPAREAACGNRRGQKAALGIIQENSDMDLNKSDVLTPDKNLKNARDLEATELDLRRVAAQNA